MNNNIKQAAEEMDERKLLNNTITMLPSCTLSPNYALTLTNKSVLKSNYTSSYNYLSLKTAYRTAAIIIILSYSYYLYQRYKKVPLIPFRIL